MLPVGFEPTISAGVRPQTYALDRAATGTGIILAMSGQNRVRKLIKLDIKKEIISKRESGKSVGDINAEYGMAKLTISII